MEGGTREERLQMRQRGAGTRKIKEVNFGFSLGSGLGIPEPTAPANPPKTKESIQSQTAPSATTPKASQAGSQRTPGSARNQLPARPSTYDLPFDEAPNHPRSNKRRKISPPNKPTESQSSSREPLPRNVIPTSSQSVAPVESSAAAAQESRTSNSARDLPNSHPTEHIPDDSATTENSLVDEASKNAETEPSPTAERDDLRIGQPQDSGTAPIDTPSDPAPDRTSLPQSESTISQSVIGPTKPTNRSQNKTQPTSPVEQPNAGSKAIKRKGRPRKSNSPISSESDKPTEKPLARNEANGPSLEADADPLPTDNQPENAPSNSKDKENQAPNPLSKASLKQRRGRKGQGAPETHEPSQVAEQAAPDVPESDPKNTQVESQPEEKRPRGRPSLGGKKGSSSEKNAQSQSPGEDAILPAEQGRPRGRPSLGGKKNNTSEKNNRPQSPTEDGIVPEKQSTNTSRRGRKPTKRPAPPSTESEQPPEPEQEPTPEPEPEAEAEAEPEPETSAAASIPRRGRPGKKSRKPEESEPSNEEGPATSEPNTQRGRPTKKAKRSDKPVSPDAEEEPATKATKAGDRETSKKTREPRGETVPVTVHRLANVSALGSMYTSRDSGDEESADELSTHHKTKLPNRGGVNPADVLSQICRETLEKTLTTLKDGIANETNTTRKAEWSRKRKAVEAFGSELDGRLLDLSEMLDSNFVLGMQLKKAKRDMMDMRSHLYRVRRERESIALQMDAVRSKHMEEENATTARSTINNSLHSLDLALDRSQNKVPSSSDPSIADLEFMLRTVADDVSSQGAHGGLLNQIRGFNAQLEAAARHLEK